MQNQKTTAVYLDPKLSLYGFGPSHPFNNDRFKAFEKQFHALHLEEKVQILSVKKASQEEIETFHTHAYVEWVKEKSKNGEGYLDEGDTPAFKGMYEAGAFVVGCVLDAVSLIMKNTYKNAFVPIAGLHHAYPQRASGFCIFNDCGIAINALKHNFNVKRIAYVDIDVHHGDGVFYAFEEDPYVLFADIHQEPLYPGTGSSKEKGKGTAVGTKLNIPLASGSGDEHFFKAWEKVIELLESGKPDFILFQCGADSLEGDPLAGLKYSPNVHFEAAKSLKSIAEKHAKGRLLAMGGGGYNLENIGKAWTSVVKGLIE
jgi:acetoin utilization protein AcuC